LGAKIIEQHQIRAISAYNLYTGAPVGVFLSLIYNLPLVVTNLGELFNYRFFFDENPKFIPKVCEVASRFVSMTHHCAKSYQLLNAAPPVEVIPIGIDLSAFSLAPDCPILRQRLGIGAQDQVVLFVGRMVKDMGLHTMLAAAPTILQARPTIQIILLGQTGELTPDARQLAQQYPGRVFVALDVPLEELPLYYAAATIVAAPTQSDRACGSLAAAEAMATGKAVVATRVGGVPEFVAHEETGLLISPEDPRQLAEAALVLLNDKTRRQQLGRNGRKRVETLFDQNITNQRYERLLREVVGGA
jgi:starch synthase